MGLFTDVPPRLPDTRAADGTSEGGSRFEEPVITDRYKWPLVALWISIGLHVALIALVKIVPPPAVQIGHTLEARLMPAAQPSDVPLYLPELAASTLDEVLAYAPPPVPASETPAQDTGTPEQASPIPQIEIPLAVDLHYYRARELDVVPNGELPDPVVPETLTGKIRYELKIEPDGRVSDVEVVSVDLVPGSDSAVLAATEATLRATRFKPGMKNGRPVRAIVVYELVINPVPQPQP